MKKIRPPLLLFCTAALGVMILGVMLNREMAKADRNETLFAAIQARDATACEAAIRAGADPNAGRPLEGSLVPQENP